MAVEGLTDRGSLVPRYPILGKFHKGGPKDEHGHMGEDLDYFRFVGAPGKEKAEVEAAVLRIYGPEPDSLDVRFPLPTMEDVFGTWREAYTKSRLLRLRFRHCRTILNHRLRLRGARRQRDSSKLASHTRGLTFRSPRPTRS